MSKSSATNASAETQLASLKREFDALRDQLLGLKPVKKDWKSTVGMLPDDGMTRSAFRCGAAWRKRRRTS